jgi:hypothetical protein
MNYAVRAWRDHTGAHGIDIGTCFPAGYDNHVAEIILTGSEISAFIAECQAAAERATQATGPFQEPMPGAYDAWPNS